MLKRVRISDSVFWGLTFVFIALTLLVGGVYLLIFIYPWVPLNPFPPPTKVAALGTTPTPESPEFVLTFPPTWTPTPTFTPTSTPTPTPTFTPTPTSTPTPTPTLTPTFTPTPRPPTPTPTPTPIPPYEPADWAAGPNCHWRGVYGVIWDSNGLPRAGVYVKIWDQAGHTVTAGPTDADGRYSIYIPADALQDGIWMLQVVENGRPASAPWGVAVGGGCINGIQEVRADWQRIY